MSAGSGHRSETGHISEVPRLTNERLEEIAESHLADLTDAERTAPLAAPHTSTPRLRRTVRSTWTAAVWVREMVVRPWQYVWDPRRPLGRLWSHLRLLSPGKTFNLWKVLLLGFAMLTAASSYVVAWHAHVWFVWLDFTNSFWKVLWWNEVNKALFVGAAVGLLAALWNDLFRLPWLCYRIRKRIKRAPECILDENLGMRPVEVVPRKDPIEIALRADLCDEVLPGVLTRASKDVQILVGEPGAGKTTALMMLAQVLARIGIMPVLVPLRGKEGQKERIKLSQKAREQFVEQVDRFVRSKDEAEKLWRWLYQRRRVAILADDADQIGADGERGAILRQTLEDAMTLDLPVLVTARPAGLPAGMAASAIDLMPLESDAALDAVMKGASKDPAFKPSNSIAPRQVEDWIREGEFTEVPFYLELLASLAAVNRCPKLPEMDQLATAKRDIGRYRRMPDGRYEWNPLWARFLLLERYYAEMAAGRVRRWLGIEAGDRRSSLVALEGAALGTLVAVGIKARAAQKFRTERVKREEAQPLREEIMDFLSFNDRADLDTRLQAGCSTRGPRRAVVSAHEAADTGERLRVLERDYQGKLQFRHRIMQAYLAGARLAVILGEREQAGTLAAEELDIHNEEPDGAEPDGGSRAQELPWVGWLLDPHHPEKLTANTALIFAAMCAKVEAEAVDQRKLSDRDRPSTQQWENVAHHIVQQLKRSAHKSLYRGDDDRGRALVELTIEEHSAGVARVFGVAVLDDEGTGRPHTAPDGASKDIDPKELTDPDERIDPDDALMKLTAAAEAAHALGYGLGDEDAKRAELIEEIVRMVRSARFATRWTKLRAIKAIAQLGSAVPASKGADVDGPRRSSARRADSLALEPAWRCIWEFARDRDYQVRQDAGKAISQDAYSAYSALRGRIRTLIQRAAARSALGLPLHMGEDPQGEPDGRTRSRAWALALELSSQESSEAVVAAGLLPGAPGSDDGEDGMSRQGVIEWHEDESLSLEALGTVLPAIVSGLREDPEMHALETWQGREEPNALRGERPSRGKRHRDEMSDVDYRQYSEVVRGAYSMLLHLVALAFQGYQHPLEDALARGFKADAMRHAHEHSELAGDGHAGPGWVASNRRVVLDICSRQAGSWYARLLLAQALALYTISGAKEQEAYNALARQVHRGRELHPFTQRGARLARAAIRRSRFPTARWHRWIWDEEAELAGRRQARLNRPTSQLSADVTLLLDLKEGSPADCQEPFGSMRDLPHCLSASRDRREILGKGCPETCGWNLCPYKQPPPDEPDSQHGISRAFCREQQRYARHQPKWQTHIRRRKLRGFWEEMERRART